MYGEKFSLSDYRRNALILCFFFVAHLAYFFKRVFDLAARQNRWREIIVEIIAVFSSKPTDIPNFRRHPKDQTSWLQ